MVCVIEKGAGPTFCHISRATSDPRGPCQSTGTLPSACWDGVLWLIQCVLPSGQAPPNAQVQGRVATSSPVWP